MVNPLPSGPPFRWTIFGPIEEIADERAHINIINTEVKCVKFSMHNRSACTMKNLATQTEL